MAERLEVGVFFNARRDQGGLYQYAATMVDVLAKHERRHRYTYLHATLEEPPPVRLPPEWSVVRLGRASVAPRMALEAALMGAARRGLERALPIVPTYRRIDHRRFDVMLYVKPTPHVFLWPYRAVFPIHDLQHALQPRFPEVSENGEGRRRDYLYRHSIDRAARVLADSRIGKEDILRVYGARPEQVRALDHLAPTYVRSDVDASDLARVRERYQPPEEFVFYPAAFWSHKNHEALLRAVALLANHGTPVSVLLAGGLSKEQPRIARLAQDLGVDKLVRFLGYVPDEDIYPLYRLALALVMPTFFGPSNLPNIEAWALGCPLVTSDIRGLREQVGDAGLLCDPNDPAAFADAIARLREQPGLREELVRRGHAKIAAWTPRDFAATLAEILLEAARGS